MVSAVALGCGTWLGVGAPHPGLSGLLLPQTQSFTALSPICQLLPLMAAVLPQKVWQCHFIIPALGCPPPPPLPQPLSLSDQALHNPLSQCRLLPNLSGAGVAAGGIGDPPCTPPGTPPAVCVAADSHAPSLAAGSWYSEGGHGGGHLALCAVPKASLAFCGCPWEVSWLRAPMGLSGFPRDTGWLHAANPSSLGTG